MSLTRHTVCFVLPWSFDGAGGVSRVVNNLMREFASHPELGIDPLALQLDWSSKTEDKLASGIRRGYSRLHSIYDEKRPLLAFLTFLAHLPRELNALRQFAKANNIASFDIHFPDLQAFAFALLRLLGLTQTEIVLSVHGSDIRAAHAQGRWAKLLWRFMLRHSTIVVACSEGLREEVLFLERRTSTAVVYNGIDIPLFARHSDPNFHWPPELQGRRLIIKVAAFEYRKGHDILLPAFEQVAAEFNDVALLLLGHSGDAMPYVNSWIRSKGMEKRVFIFEDVPHAQLYDFLSHSDVFVLATRWRKCQMGEGFALALLEAGAAQLPVVATASCGIEEIIANGENGLAVPLENASALANAISSLLSNPERAREMAASLHSLVQHKFTWLQTAEEYRRVFARL
ncbi:MAG TPA: glycosyltransferase family 4 protein [Bryobacteraceae bacterium]|nr:glycosyltransferase family 4 protein [Bryobacteraceae bacterium]